MFVVRDIIVNEIVSPQVGDAEDQSHAVLVVLFERSRNFILQLPGQQVNGAFFKFGIVICD